MKDIITVYHRRCIFERNQDQTGGRKAQATGERGQGSQNCHEGFVAENQEKSVSELKETPFASQQEESSNASANTAADQMLSGTKSTVKKGADLTYRGGKKLAQTTAKRRGRNGKFPVF